MFEDKTLEQLDALLKIAERRIIDIESEREQAYQIRGEISEEIERRNDDGR